MNQTKKIYKNILNKGLFNIVTINVLQNFTIGTRRIIRIRKIIQTRKIIQIRTLL